ncbi:MAG: ankyrin repeat domain-containing protein [Candidatus Dependentiae bacterium]|nr:ankyrin repeat domain-containing protein [Candidatus Dependentiae bacterium]
MNSWNRFVMIVLLGFAIFDCCAMQSGGRKLSQCDKIEKFWREYDSNFEEFYLNEYNSEMEDLDRARSIDNLDELFGDSDEETKYNFPKFSSADLMEAVIQKDKDLVQKILVTKVDPNKKDGEGYTPLASACQHSGTFEIVQLLCAAKANPLIKNNYGKNALELAQFFNRRRIVQYLERAA